MILNETYTLENGLSIPKLGLGTWFIDDDQAAAAVRTAVQLGYEDVAEKKLTKPELGHLKKAGVAPKKVLKEFKLSKAADMRVARSFLSPARWPRSSRPMTRPKSPSTKRSRRWALTTLTR